jgi:hypothetical protein
MSGVGGFTRGTTTAPVLVSVEAVKWLGTVFDTLGHMAGAAEQLGLHRLFNEISPSSR